MWPIFPGLCGLPIRRDLNIGITSWSSFRCRNGWLVLGPDCFLFYFLISVMVINRPWLLQFSGRTVLVSNDVFRKNLVLELTQLLLVISGGRSQNRATNYVSTRQILPRCMHIPSQNFLKLRKWYYYYYYYYYYLPWNVRLSTNRKRYKFYINVH